MEVHTILRPLIALYDLLLPNAPLKYVPSRRQMTTSVARLRGRTRPLQEGYRARSISSGSFHRVVYLRPARTAQT